MARHIALQATVASQALSWWGQAPLLRPDGCGVGSGKFLRFGKFTCRVGPGATEAQRVNNTGWGPRGCTFSSCSCPLNLFVLELMSSRPRAARLMADVDADATLLVMALEESLTGPDIASAMVRCSKFRRPIDGSLRAC